MAEINHLGIIMDGNRRWAKEKNLKPWEGHQKGSEIIADLLKWLEDFDIKEVTLYTFSVHNFNRSEIEKNFLFDLFIKEFSRLADPDHKIHQKKVKVRFLGRLSLFPPEIRQLAERIMKMTDDHQKYSLNFALGYGGREEIIDAVNQILRSGKKEVSEEEFEDFLYSKSRPEIVIRTGGEKRMSNFLTFQSAYSELFFFEKYWPDFSREDLAEVIREYSHRQRRFGR